MVEHLTLNQGVQGSNPWRSIVSTIFEDAGALGMVLFLRAMSHAIKNTIIFRGSLLTKEGDCVFYHTANAAEAKQLVCELLAWLIAPRVGACLLSLPMPLLKLLRRNPLPLSENLNQMTAVRKSRFLTDIAQIKIRK